MHFYEFNIGDYAKKTQHLTNEEDLAYRRLLDMYYDTENPVLTTGLATLSRRLRVDEKALQNVLDEFFPDGKNKHADEKIDEYHEYLIRQKTNGSKGGRPKHKPTANPVLTQNNPVPSQPLTTKPLTTKPIKEHAAAIALPDWIDRQQWDLWIATRKGKKFIPAQMQAQISKLEKWRDAGLNHAQALADAASNGWQGLYEPKRSATPTAHDARLDCAKQIFGDIGHGNNEIIDITPKRSTPGHSQYISAIGFGLREPNDE